MTDTRLATRQIRIKEWSMIEYSAVVRPPIQTSGTASP